MANLKKYSAVFLFFLISSINSIAQQEYKIIDKDLKDKIEYDNSKKLDANKRIQIYYIYEVSVSGNIEGREKIKRILSEFATQHKLESNTYDYNTNTWILSAKYNIPFESIKKILDDYVYQSSNITETFGLLE